MNINQIFEQHIQTIQNLDEEFYRELEEAGKAVKNCLAIGGKVLLMGNGGSAADAQHIAAEFTGRFVKERKGLAAISLATDTSALTAIGNDYGYDKVFERQIEALASKGDCVIGITTSGNSQNVVLALEMAKKMGCTCISLTGRDGGKSAEISDININVNSKITARIQEIHIIAGHILCEYIDSEM